MLSWDQTFLPSRLWLALTIALGCYQHRLNFNRSTRCELFICGTCISLAGGMLQTLLPASYICKKQVQFPNCFWWPPLLPVWVCSCPARGTLWPPLLAWSRSTAEIPCLASVLSGCPSTMFILLHDILYFLSLIGYSSLIRELIDSVDSYLTKYLNITLC